MEHISNRLDVEHVLIAELLAADASNELSGERLARISSRSTYGAHHVEPDAASDETPIATE